MRPGAGGTIGLAQLINNYKGDGNALMVSGKGMVSAHLHQKSPLTLSNATPIARLYRRGRGAGGGGQFALEIDGRPVARARPTRARGRGPAAWSAGSIN